MIKIFESLEMNGFSTRGPTRLLAQIGDPAVSNSKIYAFCLGLPGRFAPKTARFARGRFKNNSGRRLKISKRGGPDLAVFRRGYRVLIDFERGP